MGFEAISLLRIATDADHLLWEAGARERLFRAHLFPRADFDANPQTEPFVETKLCFTP
jgi:hypothetical protein